MHLTVITLIYHVLQRSVFEEVETCQFISRVSILLTLYENSLFVMLTVKIVWRECYQFGSDIFKYLKYLNLNKFSDEESLINQWKTTATENKNKASYRTKNLLI